MTSIICVAPTPPTVPDIWSDIDCRELYEHAIELAEEGSPVGLFVRNGLQKYARKFDFDAMRLWIQTNSELVRLLYTFYFTEV